MCFAKWREIKLHVQCHFCQCLSGLLILTQAAMCENHKLQPQLARVLLFVLGAAAAATGGGIQHTYSWKKEKNLCDVCVQHKKNVWSSSLKGETER